MTKFGTLTKGLLGASALSLFMSGNAFAAPLNLTPAGTSVDNTFSLNYQVSSVAQTEINNNATPTSFTVDRLIDLTVDSTANTNVAPDATGQTLEFSVTNTGNDTQSYALTLEDIVSPADDFDTTGLIITYYVDDGDGLFNPGTGAGEDGAGTVIAPGAASPDIDADGILWVVVTGDIASTVTDGETDSVILVADVLEPAAGGNTAVIGDSDGNDDDLTVVENFLGDAAGDGATDGLADGTHSATGTFIVAAAEMTASKSVTVFLADGVDTATCGNFSGTADADPLSIPGSCVEYVITATNAATAGSTAEAIAITDFLPEELIYAGVTQTGFTGTPVFTALAVGTDCTVTTAPETTCEVELTGAELAPGETGTITIRALVE